MVDFFTSSVLQKQRTMARIAMAFKIHACNTYNTKLINFVKWKEHKLSTYAKLNVQHNKREMMHWAMLYLHPEQNQHSVL